MIVRIGQLAASLGVHRNTVTNWIRSGKLRAEPTAGKRYHIDEEEFFRFCREKGIPESMAQKFMAGQSGGTMPMPASREQPATGAKASPRGARARIQERPVGSVMVVGGGVAGIQASLDLADSGYYVYLVDKRPGIGGAMAQLDKTFPTNDCSM